LHKPATWVMAGTGTWLLPSFNGGEKEGERGVRESLADVVVRTCASVYGCRWDYRLARVYAAVCASSRAYGCEAGRRRGWGRMAAEY